VHLKGRTQSPPFFIWHGVKAIVAYLSPEDFPAIPLKRVWDLMQQHIVPLPPRRVSLSHAGGLVLAEDVIAAANLPPFPTVRMDGYAVRSADGQEPRQLIGAQRAGQPPRGHVGPREAMWVTTGAVLPVGADAVVPVEHVHREGNTVRPLVPVSPGMYIRPVGHDVRSGDQVLSTGTRLRSGEIGVLASLGVTEVVVHPRPRVAVLATGDELQEPGAPLSPGKIWVGNRHALLASVQSVGGEPVDMGIVPDAPDALQAAFRRAVRSADVVISTGGVSMGDADWTRDVLADIGTVHVGRMNVRPLQGAMFVTVQDTPVFALSGSPLAAWLGFFALCWMAVRLRAGEQGWTLPRVFPRVRPEVLAPGGATLIPARVSVQGMELWAEPTQRGLRGGIGAQVILYLSDESVRTEPVYTVEAWWLP